MATILIVDDRSTYRLALVTLLAGRGYRVLEAADGLEGLAAVRAERPDMIITDVLMPMMDGYEFVRQLRLDPASRGIPVVFHTAQYAAREARSLAKASGVSGVLTKPADPADVLRLVARVLSGQTGAGQPPDSTPVSAVLDGEYVRVLTDPLSQTTGDLRTANTRLRALINIGWELTSERDSARLLSRVCVAAQDLFGATYVTLGILDRTDRSLRRVETCGTEATEWHTAGAPAPGMFRTVVDERRTMRGNNPGGDPASLELPPLHPRIQAFLAVPVASAAHVYGWICLVGNEGRTFTADDEQLALALSGQVGRLYELAHEIRDREQAESAVGHERDRAQRYLDAADVILLALDLAGRITLINRKGCLVLGWSEHELLGRNWLETCLPGRLRSSLSTSGKLAVGDLTLTENPILTKAGEERLIEWHNSALRDDGGQVIGTLSSGTDITERRQAEEAQRASEGRYRTLFEYAPDGIVIADPESYYIDANASICRMLGYSRAELLGLHASDIVDRAEIRNIAPALRDIATTSNYHREWQFRRKDGSVFTADVIATPMPDGNLLGMIRDVTERRRAVEALATAEERMRFALENANVGIWDMDYTTGVLRWSTTSEAHYGLAPGTFAGTFEAFAERIHPDDRASVLATVGIAMKAGSDFSLQHRTLWPDGTVRWLSGAGRVLLGAHGEPIRGVGISQDVTDRMHAEATRARLAAIVDSSDDAIISMTLDGTILTWNAGAERLYGYTAREVVGRNRTVVVPMAQSAELISVMEKVARGEPGKAFETQRTRKDGSTIDISLTISPMTDAAGHVSGVSTIARDVTNRKKAEAEMRRLHDEIQRQRLRVFKATIRTVQDIVNNVLNGFQLVRFEAEGHLPADMLTLVDGMIEDASVKLKTLGDLETISEKEMAIGVGIDYPGSES